MFILPGLPYALLEHSRVTVLIRPIHEKQTYIKLEYIVIKDGIIIDGKACARQIISALKEEVALYKHQHHIIPKLAIILVGDDVASNIYVNNKIKRASEVGIATELKKYPFDVTDEKLLFDIKSLNNNPEISGIIVQLPLPSSIDKSAIIQAIAPEKDVDGFHPSNVGLLYSGIGGGFVPCTAKGCLELIKLCENNLSGKNVVVVGRSNIVGRPLAALLVQENCTVTICHSKTKNLAAITSKADIVVTATGSPRFFTKEYFNSNAIVRDVGINRMESDIGYELAGDVDFHSVKDHVKYITPVPGGVGPMTIAMLLQNTFIAMAKKTTIAI